MSGNKSVIMTI